MWPWHNMWSGFGWGGMLVSGIVMLLFWGGLIAMVFFALRAFTRSNQSGEGRDYSSRRDRTPLEILKERYAGGEITREEYQDIRRELET